MVGLVWWIRLKHGAYEANILSCGHWLSLALPDFLPNMYEFLLTVGTINPTTRKKTIERYRFNDFKLVLNTS